IGRAWKRGYLLYGPPGTGKSSLIAAIANYLKFDILIVPRLSLSGLLNFIDGLWSSCGEERIIILTTHHKERLDPALLRPGRMDLHIHMSYLRMTGFRTLASNYLGLTEGHPLFDEIGELLEKTDVSPAEVAEELIRSEDPDVAIN
ncbi:hypothetical protein RDABS01_006847, partial [Bienertia sinuspersici]